MPHFCIAQWLRSSPVTGGRAHRPRKPASPKHCVVDALAHSLLRALRKSFGSYYMLAGLFKCGWSTFVITGAFYFVRRWVSVQRRFAVPMTTPAVLLRATCSDCNMLPWALRLSFVNATALVAMPSPASTRHVLLHSPFLNPPIPCTSCAACSLLAHVNGITDGRLYSREVAGWALMAGFTIDAWFLGLCLQRMGYICTQVGIRARAALVQAVTHKAFRLNSVRADQAASIVNFVASDIQKIYDGALVSYLRCYYVCTKPVRSSTFLAAQRGLHVAYQLHQTWYFPFTSNNSWHSSLPSR